MKRALCLVSALLICMQISAKELTLAAYICDSMVVQRNAPITLRGHAAANAMVKVTFMETQQSARAGADGAWRVMLPAQKVSRNGQTMCIESAGESVEVRQILVGDVWLAAGQSNMAFKVRGLSLEDRTAMIKEANFEQIRYYHRRAIVGGGKLRHESDVPWSAAYGRRIYNWSALGYAFAKQISMSENVPVGIIGCAHGGSTAEAWISCGAYQTDPQLQQAIGRSYTKIDTLYKNPSTLYNSMLQEFEGVALKGVLWYQGESNAYFASKYETILAGLIKDWRLFFDDDKLPFIIVQLPAYTMPADSSKQRWAQMRWAQYKVAESMDRCYLAVTSDYGDASNIHPINKLPVAARISDIALQVLYKDKKISYLTLPQSARLHGHDIIVEISNIKDGLVLHGDADVEVCGDDGIYKKAECRVENNKILISAGDLCKPRSVRYAWRNVNTLAIYHKNGTPLSPFILEVK